MISAASGPYPVDANASNPSTGRPVHTVSSSFWDSQVATGFPNIASRSDMLRVNSCHRSGQQYENKE